MPPTPPAATVAALNKSQLGNLTEKFINAQFSQSQESAADDYSFDLIQAKKLNARGLVTAFQKLAELDGGKSDMMSSHPSSAKRAAHRRAHRQGQVRRSIPLPPGGKRGAGIRMYPGPAPSVRIRKFPVKCRVYPPVTIHFRKIGLLMQPVVETLSGLERRVDLAVSVADVEKEVQAQLKRVARTAKVPGFRPGKAPLAMLERSHGPGIRYDVINSQVGRAFEQAVDGAKLRRRRPEPGTQDRRRLG